LEKVILCRLQAVSFFPGDLMALSITSIAHPWWQPIRSDLLTVLKIADAKSRLDWLNSQALQRSCRNGRGLDLVFIDQAQWSGKGYESWIDRYGQVPTRLEGRGQWHDLFNALIWLTWPLSKAQLNRMHALAAPAQAGTRGPMRDKATLIDEQALIWLDLDPVLSDALRDRDWHRLFVAERERWLRIDQAQGLFMFGHALYEKCLAPYKALTAHVLILALPEGLSAGPAQGVSGPAQSVGGQARGVGGLAQTPAEHVSPSLLDPWLARLLSDTLKLYPLPLLGVPGWHPDNQSPAFYDDRSVFRRPANPN
jgi:hypothetical protein